MISDPEGWYGWNNPETFDFMGGSKYTYALTDEEVTITLDGYFNAPAQVVYRRPIRKSDLIKAPMVRR